MQAYPCRARHWALVLFLKTALPLPQCRVVCRRHRSRCQVAGHVNSAPCPTWRTHAAQLPNKALLLWHVLAALLQVGTQSVFLQHKHLLPMKACPVDYGMQSAPVETTAQGFAGAKDPIPIDPAKCTSQAGHKQAPASSKLRLLGHKCRPSTHKPSTRCIASQFNALPVCWAMLHITARQAVDRYQLCWTAAKAPHHNALACSMAVCCWDSGGDQSGL